MWPGPEGQGQGQKKWPRPGPARPLDSVNVCRSTGIYRPGYCTELCIHYEIDSVLEVSNSFELWPINCSHIYNLDRMNSTALVLHSATWDYFASDLPDHFSHSSQVVKEAIMTDINNLVKEFRRTSCDIGASLFAMRHLFDILQECFGILVCFDIITVFATAVDLADKNVQNLAKPQKGDENYRHFFWAILNRIRARHDDQIRANLLLDNYRNMLDRSLSKSKDMLSFLRSLPGVVVQKDLSMQGMAVLYRIKPDLLEHLIKSSIGEPLTLLRRVSPNLDYISDDYLSGYLQDRDRSQLCYCDPMLQHISICRHFLALLEGSNAVNFQS